MSVTQALQTNKDHELNDLVSSMSALCKDRNVVVQWIPSHCGLPGNETADALAKEGAQQEQTNTATTYHQEKTLIKAKLQEKWRINHPAHNKSDPYYRLTRREQVIIFRLRTCHNRLNHHLYRKFKIGRTDLCPCGEGPQTVEHILQLCKDHEQLRREVWPKQTTETQKLYGCLEDLQRTTTFIHKAGLSI